MPKSWIVLHPSDNMAVVLDPSGMPAGTQVEVDRGLGFELAQTIQRGHKFAIHPIAAHRPVIKFGHAIGLATRRIAPGEHVHIHNVDMPRSEFSHHAANPHASGMGRTSARTSGDLPTSFLGYRRDTGRAGTRNYVVVASSVNCSATVVKAICRHFERDVESTNMLARKSIDGIIPVTHASGCAQAIGGLNYEVLNRTLAGWIFHPNVVSAAVVGLGCEGTTFNSILEHKQKSGFRRSIPLTSYGIQEVGGTSAAIEHGIQQVRTMIERLPEFHRETLPISDIGLALNCGGSDALSSITANPVLGCASDFIVERGGMVALAEIPECHGCEDLLAARAADADVRDKLRAVFAWWQDYARQHRVTFNENLAPGNIAGGITTIIEKSLGAVAKAGGAPLTEVVDYSQPVTKSGFVLMNTPGFDPVSVTGLVAGGCNLVAFTTGRGSVYGCSIAPTIKIATNSELFQRMSGDMDFDAGRALEEEDGITRLGEEFLRLIVDVASGRETRSEQLGVGREEFVPWPIGETL